MNVIEVKNLIKNYKSIKALDDITFEIEEGSIFGMLGPNGAGKTTTIECVIGLKMQDSGIVKVLGIDPLIEPKKLYELIGVQFQETSYQDKIKVFELCELFMSMYKNPLDYEALLERFDLSNKKNQYIQQLSGGQKQKIAIILALIANPQIIFLDELTTGLDPKSRREMWAVVKELQNDGKTIFLTTHYMEEAAYLCDKICIVDEGKIIALDTVEGVIDFANLDNLISFETEANIIPILNEKIKGISKIDNDNHRIKIYSKREDILTDIIVLMKENNIKYKKMDITRPKLEDAFIKLTGKAWKE